MSSNRWRIAGACVATHVCLGSVYAWSVFVPALQRQTGWSKPQLTWAFSLAIAFLGLTAALAAPLVHRLGPRASVGLSAAFFCAGLVGAGLAVQARSLLLLYVCYGAVGGIGLGLGYVPPVTTLMRWFVDRKGFATGMAVGGFGLGALLASYLGEALLHRFSCGTTFLLLGALYGCVILLASRPLVLPEGGIRAARPTASAFREPLFWLLWAVFFVNIATGILLIALARPMLEEGARGTAPAVPVVTAVALMGLCNGLGRLGWASLSDRAGRTPTWCGMFLLQGAVFLVLRGSASTLAMTLGFWIVASCYGGGFAICPALVADAFGGDRAPGIYGLTLTAWGAAALVSPPLAAWMREACGSYAAVLGICAAASGVGIGLMAALRRSLAGLSRTTAVR
ncbi:MAG TPA: OFA family MFS transporter [Holophaga sp.]|nr:OFA family MFS transporter [Holophaga sp.]